MNDSPMESVRLSRLRVSRRRALGLGGSVTLGAVLAACGSGDTSSGASAPSGSTSTSTSTSASASASGTTSAAPSSELIAALDRVRTCAVARDVTQGPYWFDVDAVRSDIREDRPGTALQLAVRVLDVSSCGADGAGATPIANSVVEIWHCDAGGSYSGFESASAGGPGAGGGGGSGETSDGSYSVGDSEAATTDDATYLRGAQVADANGVVQFTTIYPGWYRGRTVHIHLKVHLDKKTVLTTQLYFDEAVNDAVFAAEPYSDHTGRDTSNAQDSIYDESGLLTVTRRDGAAVPYLALINLGVDV